MYEIEILLIDENPADVEMTQETFFQNKLKNNMNVVSSCAAAEAFLRREIAVPQPDLILLDSKFLQSTEQGIFEAIRHDELLHDVPLVMLTSGEGKGYIPLSSDSLLPPIGYVSKPLDFLQFIDVVKSVKAFKVAIVNATQGC